MPHNLGPAPPKIRRLGLAVRSQPPPSGPDHGRRLAPTPATQVACQAAGVARAPAVGAKGGHIGRPTGITRSPPAAVPAGRAHTPSSCARRSMRPCTPPIPPGTCRTSSRGRYLPVPYLGPPKSQRARAPPTKGTPASAWGAKLGYGCHHGEQPWGLGVPRTVPPRAVPEAMRLVLMGGPTEWTG